MLWTNRANLQCEERAIAAGGSGAHRVGRLGRCKRCDSYNCVGYQSYRQFAKRKRAAKEHSDPRNGAKVSVRHRSCHYAETQEDTSARAIAGGLIKWSKDGSKAAFQLPKGLKDHGRQSHGQKAKGQDD